MFHRILKYNDNNFTQTPTPGELSVARKINEYATVQKKNAKMINRM